MFKIIDTVSRMFGMNKVTKDTERINQIENEIHYLETLRYKNGMNTFAYYCWNLKIKDLCDELTSLNN